MSVRQDVTFGPDDEAGADGALTSDDETGIAALQIGLRAIARHKDLYDTGTDAPDQPVDLFVEGVQAARGTSLGTAADRTHQPGQIMFGHAISSNRALPFPIETG